MRHLKRYCTVCGWVRDHKQTIEGGMMVYQCLTCKADRPVLEIDKIMWKIRKAAAIVLVALLVSAPAMAFDRSQNPDRVPSVGLDLWKGQIAGMDREMSETNGGTVGGHADFRLPISNALSVHFFGESETVNNNLKYTDGYKIGVGMRVFLQ